MKKPLTLTCILASFLFASAHPASAEIKIGMVDMNNVFSSYHKTKDAESRINEARAAAKKELDSRMEAYKGNLEKINKLNEEINRPELSEEAKAAKSKTRDETIAETKNLEREITEFRSTREKQLQDQAVRMRNDIVKEITKLVEERVKTEKYDVVFDKSGQSLNGVPIVLFSDETMDFSDSIIKALNKSAKQ